MSQAGDLKSGFEKTQKQYERLAQVVEDALRKYLDQDEVKVHAVTSRAKEWESFKRKATDKIQSGKWANPLQDCVDRAGARVVCLYRDDMGRVEKAIRTHLEVVSVDKKDTEPDRFGYRGWHFVVRIRENWGGPQYEGLHDLKCEIQVRTILMDAWASVSHHIDYKDDAAIPDQLRKDFYALSGALHVADAQFGNLLRAQRRSQEEASKTVGAGRSLFDVPVDHDTLQAYLDLGFPRTPRASPDLVSSFARVLRELGYQTVADVDQTITRAKPGCHELEQVLPARMQWRVGGLNQGGRLAAALLLGDHRYIERDTYWDPCANDVEEIAAKYGLRRGDAEE